MEEVTSDFTSLSFDGKYEEETTTPVFDGIEGDLIVKVDDQEWKAHKCVLKSCPYFSAVIEGNWQESQNSVVNLCGYSPKSVKLVIEHLYKPKTTLENDTDLVELMVLTDMLGLISLLTLITKAITSKLCHNFHKPCPECITGITLTLQLARTYNLTEMKVRCMEWLTKYLTKTWNSRSFAALEEDIQRENLEFIKKLMNVNTILDLLIECQLLQDTLPSVKWVDPVKTLAFDLHTASMDFLKENFHTVLQSSKFQSYQRGNSWDISRVELFLLDAALNLPVEQACLSYSLLNNTVKLLDDANESDTNPDPVYVDFMRRLTKNVERRLVQRVAMATKCTAWNAFSKDVQAHIMQQGLFDPLDMNATKVKTVTPRISSAQLKSSRNRIANSANGSTNTAIGVSRTAQRRPVVSNARQPTVATSTTNNGRSQANIERPRVAPKTSLTAGRSSRPQFVRAQLTPTTRPNN